MSSVAVTFAACWLAATSTAVLLTGCGDEPAPPPPIIRPVRTEPVYATGGERTRYFSGTSRAAVESKLSFKVPGTVQKLHVAVGDRVAVGQLIAELDDTDLRLQVQEAEAGLKSAQAQARNAKANYERVQKLYENRNASRHDLDGTRAASVSANENASSVEKRLELAQAQLGYATLRAQIAGSIAAVPAELNENVSPGVPVVLLTSEGRLEVEVAIPEVLITQVREGDAVEVKFDAIKDKLLGARVTEVGVISTGAATTFPVTVRMDEEDEDCRPGMAAEVGFRFGGRGGREHIFVPGVAVSEDRQGRFVYVVETDLGGNSKAVRRQVQIKGEISDGGLMEIVEGLADGEFVVTAGVSRIIDGQTVRLLPK